MYPRLLLIVTGLAAFLGGLVLLAPLSTVVRVLPPESALRTASLEGTLLNGRATIVTSGGPVRWSFQLQPHWLLTLGLGGKWQLVGADAEGNGTAVLRPWGLSANIESGKVAASRIARALGGGSFETTEPLLLQGLALTAAWGSGLTGADGTMVWGPGQVQLAGRAQPVMVPELLGRLETSGGQVALHVGAESAPDDALLTANLTLADRQLHVVVPGRALRVLGLGTRFPDDKPAFELKQPLR